MNDCCNKLARALDGARGEDGFPQVLAARIERIAGAPAACTGREDLVEELALALANFDPYAGAGCFGDGVPLSRIERLVGALEQE